MSNTSNDGAVEDAQLHELDDFPPGVLDAILSASKTSKENFSGRRVLDKQILLTDELTINALSQTFFRIRTLPPEHPFYVVAARLVLTQVGPTDDHAALLDFLYEGPALQGNPGQPGNDGRSWGVDWTAEDGGHGGRGDTGGVGADGKTLDKPPLFFVYKEVRLIGGNPVTALPLTLNMNGYKGGNGEKAALAAEAVMAQRELHPA